MIRRLIDTCVMLDERGEGSKALENMVARLMRHIFQNR